MKNLPVDTPTFRNLKIKKWFSVDKTENIHRLLIGRKISFLSGPRSLGKSFLLAANYVSAGPDFEKKGGLIRAVKKTASQLSRPSKLITLSQLSRSGKLSTLSQLSRPSKLSTLSQLSRPSQLSMPSQLSTPIKLSRPVKLSTPSKYRIEIERIEIIDESYLDDLTHLKVQVQGLSDKDLALSEKSKDPSKKYEPKVVIPIDEGDAPVSCHIGDLDQARASRWELYDFYAPFVLVAGIVRLILASGPKLRPQVSTFGFWPQDLSLGHIPRPWPKSFRPAFL
jgi:hypothetical protein